MFLDYTAGKTQLSVYDGLRSPGTNIFQLKNRHRISQFPEEILKSYNLSGSNENDLKGIETTGFTLNRKPTRRPRSK